MRIATITVTGLTPYSQSQAFQTEKRANETHDDFDKRAWPEHMHVNVDGQVFVPAVAIMQGMAAAASYLSAGTGGEMKKKGSATWAKNFNCGLSVGTGPILSVTSPKVKKPAVATTDAAVPERVYCNADGKRGSGKRVWRTFPVFYDWKTTFEIHILDDSIPEDIFDQVLKAFGLFIGIGRYRPQNGGYLGRFTIEKVDVQAA